MSEPQPGWAPRDAVKRALFDDDLYYQEGLATFRRALAGRPQAAQLLGGAAFLLIKPESIVGRRTGQILDSVAAAGFRTVGLWPVRLGRHEARNLWRYSLNTVPIAHVRALEMLVSSGPAFLLGLRGDAAGPAGPGPSAAERLTALKGSSSAPEASGTLRRQLGCPALMLNFVHAPDEPADVLRELSVLCEPGLLTEIAGALTAAAGWPAARFEAAAGRAAAALTAQSAQTPAHDLDVAAALGRLRSRLDRGPGLALPPAARDAVCAGRVPDDHALEVIEALERAAELPRWDRVVAAAYLVDGLRTGRAPLVGGPAGHPLAGQATPPGTAPR